MAVWRLVPGSAEQDEALARASGLPRIVASLLRRRGVETAEQARAYLRPADGELHDPMLLEGAAVAG